MKLVSSSIVVFVMFLSSVALSDPPPHELDPACTVPGICNETVGGTGFGCC